MEISKITEKHAGNPQRIDVGAGAGSIVEMGKIATLPEKKKATVSGGSY